MQRHKHRTERPVAASAKVLPICEKKIIPVAVEGGPGRCVHEDAAFAAVEMILFLVSALRLATLGDVSGQKAVRIDEAAADDRWPLGGLPIQHRTQDTVGTRHQAGHILLWLVACERRVVGGELVLRAARGPS